MLRKIGGQNGLCIVYPMYTMHVHDDTPIFLNGSRVPLQLRVGDLEKLFRMKDDPEWGPSKISQALSIDRQTYYKYLRLRTAIESEIKALRDRREEKSA